MKKIMVVDDTRVLTDLYCRLLEKRGYTAFRAYNGIECIDMIAGEKPDMILLDIMMEPLDGWGTLERIKKNPETEQIPVVMMTAKAPLPEDIIDYGRILDGYVIKPVKPDELEGIIKMVAERRRMAAESRLMAVKAGACEEKQKRLFNLFIQQDVLERLRNLLFETYTEKSDNQKSHGDFESTVKSVYDQIKSSKEEFLSLKDEIGIA